MDNLRNCRGDCRSFVRTLQYMSNFCKDYNYQIGLDVPLPIPAVVLIPVQLRFATVYQRYILNANQITYL